MRAGKGCCEGRASGCRDKVELLLELFALLPISQLFSAQLLHLSGQGSCSPLQPLFLGRAEIYADLQRAKIRSSTRLCMQPRMRALRGIGG